MTHVLKSHIANFTPIVCGERTADIRRDDREPPYMKGDELLLQEWNPDMQAYTGGTVRALITSVSRGVDGISDGYVMVTYRLPVDAFRFDAGLVVQAGA